MQGEGLLAGKKNTSKGGGALTLDWDSGEVKDGRRQRYSDTEEFLASVNLSQEVIHEEWSELASNKQDEVLQEYRTNAEIKLGLGHFSGTIRRSGRKRASLGAVKGRSAWLPLLRIAIGFASRL